jgi:hypothetical protein
VLVQNAHRPVVVFTHAPPIGTGLKVLQSVHIKNRCAYLNHSDRWAAVAAAAGASDSSAAEGRALHVTLVSMPLVLPVRAACEG